MNTVGIRVLRARDSLIVSCNFRFRQGGQACILDACFLGDWERRGRRRPVALTCSAFENAEKMRGVVWGNVASWMEVSEVVKAM